MEAADRSGSSPAEAAGIPSGLNRIRTRRMPSNDRLSSGGEDSPSDAPAAASVSEYGVPRPPPKQAKGGNGGGGAFDGKNRFRKGKKIARWFASYLSRDANRELTNIPPNEIDGSELGTLDKNMHLLTENQMEPRHSKVKDQLQRVQLHARKPSKGVKSFSHELGPKGGIQPVHPRAHSYDDLKELLRSLHSRFDAAKAMVNAELSAFAGDILELLEKEPEPSPTFQGVVEDLLILAHQCMEMSPSDFRGKCEGIVQELAVKRQKWEAGVLKQLFTRMLFILTRCTRILQFQKNSEPMDEDSLYKFKQCLENVPAVEMSWLSTPEKSPDKKEKIKNDKNLLNRGNKLLFSLGDSQPEINHQVDNNSMAAKRNIRKSCRSDDDAHRFFRSQSMKATSDVISNCHPLDYFLPSSMQKDSLCQLQESGELSDESHLVICRICEELVPTAHLESHSYICAYADKCDVKGMDVDERLTKISEIVEQIVDSYTSSFRDSYDSPEIPRIANSNSVVGSECHSPRITEWHSKGTEGMFEDLHEMDAACIEESNPANNNNMKAYFSAKLGQSVAPSSSGSFTSVSSANTPRACHFDMFWLEHNNPREPENVMQMTELADIARCVTDSDLTKEGSSEYLLACMLDLQDILQHSKVKALVIDTFGSRIENMIREKYLLACELMDESIQGNKANELMVDIGSQNMMPSLHPIHKDRTSIEDFEIIKPISRGAFGKVFLARKRTTGDLFAIKVLKKLDMLRKNDIERILAERNILITVRNPFVVRFFYSFTCRENLYLVMEYLNGGDLYSLLKSVGCLEEDVVRIYIAELVLALEYLHSLGIVHRDLKPDNILIAHDGHIKLTDFGLSRIGLINGTIDLSGSGVDTLDTSPQYPHQQEGISHKSAVGTPDYLAPEILLGIEHGSAADWWSVGIILFELITGIPPFTARLPEIIFDNILNHEIPWPDIPSDMSYEAQALIKGLLIHNPNQRLGVHGASEVKAHPFFTGINWETLAMQKAAFVPNPESADDTSYFLSRYSQSSVRIIEDDKSSDCASEATDSESNSGIENHTGEHEVLADSDGSPPLSLSQINFSFKNLSQLASINYDVLLQSGKATSKCSSPLREMQP